MLFFFMILLNGFFYMLFGDVKMFYGVWEVLNKISLLGIMLYMYLLGKEWEVFVVFLVGDIMNLIYILDWNFNW